MDSRFPSLCIGQVFSVFEIITHNNQNRQEIAYKWIIDSENDALPCFVRTSYGVIKSYKLIGRLIIKVIK